MKDVIDDYRPLIVLIDVEGLDCDIVNRISPSSLYLRKYLIFEIKQYHDIYEA